MSDPLDPPTPDPGARRPRRSLILAGGGYKVAFQAGVLQVWLDEAGLEFDHADGASGGNLNLAMWCQGMSGRRIADNWRELPPRIGMGFNWREWWKGPFAASILTLDNFRRNVLGRWGLDWSRIRATDREATFNLYDFTAHELVPMPAAEMDADLLMASISIPMWFPPVRIRDHTWMDAVFLSDANLEAAIDRGADELWVIWTVSEKSVWRSGFVGIYFGIIEMVANGNLRRVLRRIERSNRAIAAGGAGEFGRPVEVKVLRAEVPIHYLLVLSGDRVRESVERGVAEARRWCLARGIPLVAPGASPDADDRTVLRFTEEMKGHVTLGETDPERGEATGKAAGTRLMVHLTVTVDGVRRFLREPAREGSITGYVESEALGGRSPVESGTFNLFTDAGDPAVKTMAYRLFTRDAAGEPITLSGFKHVLDDPGADLWSDTSTLFTRILRGHVDAAAEATGTDQEVLAAGVIHVQLLDFLHQLTTFRVEAAGPVEQASVLAEFGAFFMGRLWDVYADRVIGASPI